MRVIISVIYEVAAFLIHEPHTTPRGTPRTPCAFDGLSGPYTPHSEALGLSDYLLSSLSSVLGLELPRAVTILNGLPLATSLLLRLTEVIPPELILFFCLTGMIFWILIVVVCLLLLVCTGGLLLRVLFAPPRVMLNWLLNTITPPEQLTPQALTQADLIPAALPPNRPAALSDEVRSFADEVRVHNPATPPPFTLRRSARHHTRS